MMMQKRKKLLIDQAAQIPFMIRFSVWTILGAVVVGVIVYAFAQESLTVSIENTQVIAKSTADFLFPILVLTVLVVTVFSAGIVLFLSLLVSHRFLGPVYRFKKELELIKQGDLTRSFKIREKDYLKDLASDLNETTKYLAESHSNLKKRITGLIHYIQTSSDPNDQAKLTEVERQLNEIYEKLQAIKTE